MKNSMFMRNLLLRIKLCCGKHRLFHTSLRITRNPVQFEIIKIREKSENRYKGREMFHSKYTYRYTETDHLYISLLIEKELYYTVYYKLYYNYIIIKYIKLKLFGSIVLNETVSISCVCFVIVCWIDFTKFSISMLTR